MQRYTEGAERSVAARNAQRCACSDAVCLSSRPATCTRQASAATRCRERPHSRCSDNDSGERQARFTRSAARAGPCRSEQRHRPLAASPAQHGPRFPPCRPIGAPALISTLSLATLSLADLSLATLSLADLSLAALCPLPPLSSQGGAGLAGWWPGCRFSSIASRGATETRPTRRRRSRGCVAGVEGAQGRQLDEGWREDSDGGMVGSDEDPGLQEALERSLRT